MCMGKCEVTMRVGEQLGRQKRVVNNQFYVVAVIMFCAEAFLLCL